MKGKYLFNSDGITNGFDVSKCINWIPMRFLYMESACNSVYKFKHFYRLVVVVIINNVDLIELISYMEIIDHLRIF